MAHVAALLEEATPRALAEEGDHDLVAAVRGGDDRAFEQLYQRYHRRISAYVRAMVRDHTRAEDITQEVFLSALRRLRANDQDIALKPWMYEIARNACIDQYRRAQRTPEVPYEGDSGHAERMVAYDPTPEAAVDTKQELDHLCHAFRGLTQTQHQVLVLREFEGLSYREIGERMNLTRPAVESALFRARRRLLEEYEELSTGARCLRVQRAILAVRDGSGGVRDRLRIASHVSRCANCRRQARLSGLDAELTHPSLPARVAALLPLPAFLRRLLAPREGGPPGSLSAAHASGLAGWAGAVGGAAEPFAGWAAAGAAAATLAIVIGGTSVLVHSATQVTHPILPATLVGGGVDHRASTTAPSPGAARQLARFGVVGLLRGIGASPGTSQPVAGSTRPTVAGSAPQSSRTVAAETHSRGRPTLWSGTPLASRGGGWSYGGRGPGEVRRIVTATLNTAQRVGNAATPRRPVGSVITKAQGAGSDGTSATSKVSGALQQASAAVGHAVPPPPAAAQAIVGSAVPVGQRGP